MATIGNPLTGGSTRSLVGGNIRGPTITDFPGGTANLIRVKCDGVATDEWQACIYEVGGGDDLLLASAVRTDIGSVAVYEFAFTPTLIPAGVIVIAVGSNAAVTANMYYDSFPYAGAFLLGVGVDPPPATGSFNADPTRPYSVELEYTPLSSAIIVPGAPAQRNRRHSGRFM